MSEFIIQVAGLEDAPAMAAIHGARRCASLPSYPDHAQAKVDKLRGWTFDSLRQAEDCIINTRRYPHRHLSLVALIGEEVVAYANARVQRNPSVVRYNGLFVREEYEGRGIGQALDNKRYAWGRRFGLPIQVSIDPANKRSMNFFGLRGFRLVGQEVITHRVEYDMARNYADIFPVILGVYELGDIALSSELSVTAHGISSPTLSTVALPYRRKITGYDHMVSPYLEPYEYAA